MFYYKNTQNTLCKYQNGKACDRDSCLISCISLLQEGEPQISAGIMAPGKDYFPVSFVTRCSNATKFWPRRYIKEVRAASRNYQREEAGLYLLLPS